MDDGVDLGMVPQLPSLGERTFFSYPLIRAAPEDTDELRAWKWGRQLRYALLALLLSMIAFAVILQLNGE